MMDDRYQAAAESPFAVRLGEHPKALPYSTDDFRKEIKRVKHKRRLAAVACALVAVMVALVVVAIVVLGLPGSLKTVPSDDMAPVVSAGDLVIVDKGGSLAEGEVVLFSDTEGNSQVKRIVALGGNWVNVATDGTVVVAAASLEGAPTEGLAFDGASIIASRQVPDGACFVMADSETSAVEALYRADNYLAASQVVGVVRYRVWPPAVIDSTG